MATLTLQLDAPEIIDALLTLQEGQARLLRQCTEIIRRLGDIEQRIRTLTINDTINTEALMADFTELLAAVAENTSIDASIVAALDANTTLLRDVLAERGVDQAIIDDAVAAITASNADTAEAVTRNTVADPDAEPTPEPEPTPEG